MIGPVGGLFHSRPIMHIDGKLVRELPANITLTNCYLMRMASLCPQRTKRNHSAFIVLKISSTIDRLFDCKVYYLQFDMKLVITCNAGT